MNLRTNVLQIFCCACLLAASSLAAPAAAAGQERADSVRAELARLATLVDSLSREVARLRASGQEEEAGDALADLRAAAAAAAATGGAPQAAPQGEQSFVGRQRALQSLNPEISVNADVLAHVAQDDPGHDNFVPREFEISIKSALDPYSRASIAISREAHGAGIEPFHEEGEEEEEGHEEGHGDGFGLEEGYVEWVSLPGGFGLKLGKFFQRFGTLNRWHSHALPFQSRSLPHLAFLGEEALSQTGVSVSWLAPFGLAGGTYDATVELTRSENANLFGESESLSVLTHLNAFWALSSATDLDLALSWIGGDYEDPDESFRRDAYTAELSFSWRPPARSRQRGVTVRAGYMAMDRSLLARVDGADDLAIGLWSAAEVRLSPGWLVGARFDHVEHPVEADVSQWLVSPTLTWWQSEFVRVRLEYDFLSGLAGGDGSGRFVLQTTFAMGPHKHSTY